MLRRSFIVLGLIIVLAGCATITRGTEEALVISSTPSGAQVELSNGMSGRTPASFTIDRDKEVVVTISKDGYETVTVNVSCQVAGAGAAGMAGNVVLGGLIGAAVDAGSGAMMEHKPNPVEVTLEPIGPSSHLRSSRYRLLVRLEPRDGCSTSSKAQERSEGKIAGKLQGRGRI
jgi:hypothetical protein